MRLCTPHAAAVGHDPPVFGRRAGMSGKLDGFEATHVRTRAMERKLKDVEQLPEKDADGLLGIDDDQDLLNGSNPFENRRLAS